MERGNLIIYDADGKIWRQTGDASGDVLPHEYPNGLPYIELEFGATRGKRILSVDVETKEVITEDIIIPKTEAELRIEELENQILINEGLI